MMVTGRIVLPCRSAGVLQEDLFVYPHEAAGLVGLGLVLDAVEAVAELAVFSLVVVVVFHLPHCLKHAGIFELQQQEDGRLVRCSVLFIHFVWMFECLHT